MSKFKVGEVVIVACDSSITDKSCEKYEGTEATIEEDIELTVFEDGEQGMYYTLVDTDGDAFWAMEHELKKKYDGDQLTNWSSLKDIYNPEKVGV